MSVETSIAGINVAVLRSKAGCTDCALRFSGTQRLTVTHNGKVRGFSDLSGAWITDVIEWLREQHGR